MPRCQLFARGMPLSSQLTMKDGDKKFSFETSVACLSD